MNRLCITVMRVDERTQSRGNKQLPGSDGSRLKTSEFRGRVLAKHLLVPLMISIIGFGGRAFAQATTTTEQNPTTAVSETFSADDIRGECTNNRYEFALSYLDIMSISLLSTDPIKREVELQKILMLMGYNPRENPDKTKPCKSGIVEDYEKARMLIINNMTGETLRACVNTLSGMVTNKKGNQTNPSKVEEGNRLVMGLISTMDSQELFMALCPEVFRYLAN